MKRYLSTIVVGVACFGIGIAFQRYSDSRGAAVPQTAQVVASEPSRNAAFNLANIKFENEPLWAYGFDTMAKPEDKAPPQNAPNRNLRPNQDPEEQTRMRRVEGSNAQYSFVDVRDGSNVIDWFPEDHPMPMPDVIKYGPKAGDGNTKRGCGSCHLPNGHGRPENAPPGGLPAVYSLRQLQDFRSGLRRTADPRKPNTFTMIDLAKAMTDEEMKQAAEYFAGIKYSRWTRVVETDMVPNTKIQGNLFIPISEEKAELIAGRIIEVPENEEQNELLRNPRMGFVAYVPPGSIEKGRDLVTTGGMRIVDDKIVQGKTTACGTCHGVDLMGVADVPPIAGRSPSYIVRQIWDMQQGTRNGASAQLMKVVVANLTPDDLVAIAAYVASREPVASHTQETRLTNLLP